MGSQIILNGDATTMQLTFGGTNVTVDDFIAGDVITITPVNPQTSRTYGAKNSVNIQRRVDKDVKTVIFRVTKFGATDIAITAFNNAETLTRKSPLAISLKERKGEVNGNHSRGLQI